MIKPIRTNAFLPLLVLAAFTFSGCQKGTVDPGGGGGGGGSNTGGPGGGPTLNGSPMIMGDIDGVAFSMVANGNTVIVNSSMAAGSPTFWISGVVDAVSMQFANFYFGALEPAGEAPTDAEFTSFFTPGTRPYAIVQMLMENGVEFEYLDEDQMQWRTSCGDADQTGSTFTITAVESTSGGSGTSMRIVGTFSAKLHECTGDGGIKNVTNGKFRLDIPNY